MAADIVLVRIPLDEHTRAGGRHRNGSHGEQKDQPKAEQRARLREAERWLQDADHSSMLHSADST